MNIDLPEKFFYRRNKDTKDYALVENGILKIYGMASFEDLMYAVTYCLKGRKCVYCGLKKSRTKMTLDHVVPREFGGPTISNNLVPACKKCNAEKSNMTVEDFLQIRTMQTKQEKQRFKQQLKERQESIKRNKGFSLPRRWYTPNYQIRRLLMEIRFDRYPISKKDKSIEQFYQKYGHFQKLIILDKNGYLLSGFKEVMFAKKEGIPKVPAIVLENVERIL